MTRSEASDPDVQPFRFEDLFATESRRLFAALVLITRDPQEAADVGQEAFIRVLEQWDRIASMQDPVGYLYRVAMNVFRSHYRKARIASRLHVGTPVVDDLEAVDDRDEVDRLLARLSPRQRAAVVLTMLLDYSSDEAGGMIGIPGSSVRVLTARARATLREHGAER